MFLLAGCKQSAKHAVFWRRVEDVLFPLAHEKLLHSSPVLVIWEVLSLFFAG